MKRQTERQMGGKIDRRKDRQKERFALDVEGKIDYRKKYRQIEECNFNCKTILESMFFFV